MPANAVAVAATVLGLLAQAAPATRPKPAFTAVNEAVSRYELDLTTLRVSQAAVQTAQSRKIGYQIMNTTIHGLEVACLNCNNEDLFKDWVRQVANMRVKRCGDSNASVSSGKHPNSPGYKKWKAKSSNAKNFLAVDTQESSTPCNDEAVTEVKLSHSYGWDTADDKQRLQALWQNRRLVVGAGADPTSRSMNFVGALVDLAQEAPELTPKDCDKRVSAHCDSLMSGKRTASTEELRQALKDAFGADFLNKHEYQEKWNETEQRHHVQAVLTELKGKYSFYYQKCLAHETASSTCNISQPSALLGRMPCKPDDDEVSDDCVYAEVRLCNACAVGPRFFEYSRFHGPLALFATHKERNGLMGQCEEFSRAAHALLSSLGFNTRYILDFTDHVWVEVQLPKGKQGKWVHADPSEGVLDSPHMYEEHWGKQLTMIFAFTPHRMEHVTRTYTEDYASTIARRGINEHDLDAALEEVNHRLEFELPSQRFGHTSFTSKDRSLDEIALWSHFEAN